CTRIRNGFPPSHNWYDVW
nr:immunoglobulin heavy chain junction region [Macaca mulatta]MOX15105.1 immunoglobulin heavy chain junction region [Macaca mulatta]MOX15503.1 immunoglobulin heavy chain junction region [Macaca mulatta]MOX16323.1 immunoglobulin heavy chain junction region [Macaca mulatta]MOX16647.1 immunoglobulin heavy chain junction region [Macaca mulatta]